LPVGQVRKGSAEKVTEKSVPAGGCTKTWGRTTKEGWGELLWRLHPLRVTMTPERWTKGIWETAGCCVKGKHGKETWECSSGDKVRPKFSGDLATRPGFITRKGKKKKKKQKKGGGGTYSSQENLRKEPRSRTGAGKKETRGKILWGAVVWGSVGFHRCSFTESTSEGLLQGGGGEKIAK